MSSRSSRLPTESSSALAVSSVSSQDLHPAKSSVNQNPAAESLGSPNQYSIPFTEKDISPSNTSAEMLQSAQEYSDYIMTRLGVKDRLPLILAPPEMSTFLHGMPAQYMAATESPNALSAPSDVPPESSISADPVSPASETTEPPNDVPPSEVLTPDSGGLQEETIPPSEVLVHDSEALGEENVSSEPSQPLSVLLEGMGLTERDLNIMIDQVRSLVDETGEQPSHTDLSWSSDEALSDFPVAEGMAGMTNPEGMAHRRLERINRVNLMHAIFLPDITTENLSPDLCTVCSNLGLTAESFLPRGPYSTIIPREWDEKMFDRPLQDIRMETSCPLCRLITSAAETACSIDGIDPRPLNCTLVMTMFSCFWDNRNRFESFRFLTVNCNNPGSDKKLISADLIPVESKRYPLGFIGRTIDPDRISPTLIRRWLHQCEQVHGPSCSRMEFLHYGDRDSSPSQSLARFSGLLPSLYFIDVHQSRLVTLHSSARYIALSYVWGNCKTSHTTKATLDGLKGPGGLSVAMANLPAVIRDSIQLTMDLGERYLWVDSLCIVQDDHDTKMDTINKMNLIYENALLTIIAATGANADTGLPGVNPHSRILTQECANIAEHLKMIVPHSLKALKNSVWASRAWTYQENFFSQRRLIFLNGQVVFKCGWDAPSREDILSELQIFGMEDYTYKLPQSQLGEGHSAKSAGHTSRQFLPSLVSQYTLRNLSYQGDILYAFAGIKDMFGTEGSIELCFGLDKETLGLGLLWQSGLLKRRVGFPSWSWAGWIGPVQMVSYGGPPAKWITQKSWINWYLIGPQNEFHLVPQLEWEPDTGDGHNLENSSEDKNSWNSPRVDGKIADSDNIDRLPGYMKLLHNHIRHTRLDSTGLARSHLAPTTRSLDSLPIESTIKLPPYALLFQTLKGNAWISIYDPLDRVREYATHVHLYDESSRYLGVAWINDVTFWTQAGYFSQDMPQGRKSSVEIALLSGPEPATEMVKRTYIWPETATSESISESQSDVARFYRVILLAPNKHVESGCPQTYERLGMGEVQADMMENWNGLKWADILVV